MPQASRTFRVFVSSTFSDLKEERNALQERVFPRLRDLAMAHGCRFQAIDLRWGVSEEAALDQQTMKICLSEIARSQKTSPKPNFIVLLGNRYGWRPLPAEIPADEYERIIAQVTKEDRSLLEQWYCRDDNAVPPEFCLQPRGGEYVAYDSWEKLEDQLRQIFLAAIEKLPLSPDEAIKYTASATEQEIVHGALRVLDAQEHVFGYLREIEGLPLDERGEGFNDRDAGAAQKQEELKARLGQQLPGNIHSYTAHWQDKGPSLDHLDQLCEDVFADLSKVMLAEISHLELVDPLDKEITAHDDFGKDRARVFVGRTDLLKSIADYIKGNDPHPLAVWGVSGSGKSALMARAVQQVRESGKNVIVRFIGATPESSNGRALLASLCHQISKSYGADETNIPLEYKDLVGEFIKRLALATPDKPLVLFLDALDQLSNADNAHNLIWLSADLPANARLIVSTLPGECLSALERKLPASNRHQLEPLSIKEGSEALELWLTGARRTLQPEQRAAVLNQFTQNGLPLYLKLAFEQTRLWRSYDDVRDLGANIPESIGNLLARLSASANHGEVIVSHCLGYLAASKNGLTEDELLQVLSRDLDVCQWFVQSVQHIPSDLLMLALSFHIDKDPSLCTVQEHEDTIHWLEQIIKNNPPALVEFLQFAIRASSPIQLPVLLWSRLYFDLEPYLTERSADGMVLMTFYYRELGEAVRSIYLSGRANETHRALANYFYPRAKNQKLSTLHDLREAPFQLAQAGERLRLAALLSDLEYLDNRCISADVFGLIQDYSMLGAQDAQELAAYTNFLRKHAHRLDEYPSMFFSLCYHEGFEAIRLRAHELAANGGWHKPWLELDQAWMPTLTQSVTLPQIEVLAQCNHEMTAVSAVAVDLQLAFYLRRLGQVGMVDLLDGREQSETVPIQRAQPLTLTASPNGRVLACDFADGRLDVHALQYDAARRMIASKPVVTLSRRLPISENPVTVLEDTLLLYQDESGVLVEFDLENKIPRTLELPRQLLDAEWSGYVSLPFTRVFAFRHGQDTLLIASNRTGGIRMRSFPKTDVKCMCSAGENRIALALTNHKLVVLNLDAELSDDCSVGIQELPSCIVKMGNSLFWLLFNGEQYWWEIGSRIVQSQQRERPEQVYPTQLVALPDTSYALLTTLACIRFSVASAAPRRADAILAAFQTLQSQTGYFAFQDRMEGLWLLDGLHLVDRPVLFNSQALRACPPGLQKFAMDGQGNLFGTERRRGAFVMRTSDGKTAMVSDTPFELIAVVGDPDTGFWLADDGGKIYFTGLDAQCREIGQLPVGDLGNANLYCSPGWLIWEGLALRNVGFGMEYVDVVIFMTYTHGPERVRLTGERTFLTSDGVFDALAIEPQTGNILTFWTGGSRYPHHAKVGSVVDYVKERERIIPLEGMDSGWGGVRVLTGALYAYSKLGNVFRLDLATLRVQASYSGSRAVTELAGGSSTSEPLLLSLDRSTLSFCRFHGG